MLTEDELRQCAIQAADALIDSGDAFSGDDWSAMQAVIAVPRLLDDRARLVAACKEWLAHIERVPSLVTRDEEPLVKRMLAAVARAES